MSPQTILAVRFRLAHVERDKEIFKQHLITLFDILAAEPAFVSAVIQEDLDHSNEVVVHERWNVSRERFLKEEMTKPYRGFYEQLLVKLGIEREVQWLQPFADWDGRLTRVHIADEK